MERFFAVFICYTFVILCALFTSFLLSAVCFRCHLFFQLMLLHCFFISFRSTIQQMHSDAHSDASTNETRNTSIRWKNKPETRRFGFKQNLKQVTPVFVSHLCSPVRFQHKSKNITPALIRQKSPKHFKCNQEDI